MWDYNSIRKSIEIMVINPYWLSTINFSVTVKIAYVFFFLTSILRIGFSLFKYSSISSLILSNCSFRSLQSFIVTGFLKTIRPVKSLFVASIASTVKDRIIKTKYNRFYATFFDEKILGGSGIFTKV